MHRDANIGDLDFIYDLIMNGAKQGFFNRKFQQLPAAAHGLRLEISLILESRIRPNGLKASGIIYQHKGQPIGFVLMSAGEKNKGNELWMVAIHKDFQKKGYGKKMVQGVLDKFKGLNLMLFARCSPESEKMYQLLLKNGFAHVETSEEGYRGMIYEL